jgi:hypothetical protein
VPENRFLERFSIMSKPSDHSTLQSSAEAFTPNAFTQTGSNLDLSDRLPGDLRKIIRSVDFVVGVFLCGSANRNTMFEVGLAVGAGKPVLLVVADESKVPSDLAGFPFVRASLTDDKAIELHLDLLIRRSRHGPCYPVSAQSRTVSAVSPPTFGLRSSLLHDLQPANPIEAELFLQQPQPAPAPGIAVLSE